MFKFRNNSPPCEGGAGGCSVRMASHVLWNIPLPPLHKGETKLLCQQMVITLKPRGFSFLLHEQKKRNKENSRLPFRS